jgi:hypothetical protein
MMRDMIKKICNYVDMAAGSCCSECQTELHIFAMSLHKPLHNLHHLSIPYHSGLENSQYILPVKSVSTDCTKLCFFVNKPKKSFTIHNRISETFCHE